MINTTEEALKELDIFLTAWIADRDPFPSDLKDEVYKYPEFKKDLEKLFNWIEQHQFEEGTLVAIVQDAAWKMQTEAEARDYLSDLRGYLFDED